MRLDLFLKTSRLVKRRSVAQELCEAGRVFVNGNTARPAKDIRPGDLLTLTLETRTLEIEVIALPASAKNVRVPPEELYRVAADRRVPRSGL